MHSWCIILLIVPNKLVKHLLHSLKKMAKGGIKKAIRYLDKYLSAERSYFSGREIYRCFLFD